MLKDLNLGPRLGLAFGVVLLLLVVVGVFAIRGMNTLSELNRQMYRHPFTVNNTVLIIDASIVRIHHTMQDMILSEHHLDIPGYVKQVERLEAQIFNDFKLVEQRFLGDKRKYQKALDLFREWKPILDEITDLCIASHYRQAAMITKGKGAAIVWKLMKAMQALNQFSQKKAITFYEEAQEHRKQVIGLTSLTIALALVVGLIFTILITRSVTVPTKNIAQVAESIANGDLSLDIKYRANNELGQMAESLRKMLVGVIGEGQSIKQGMPTIFWTTDLDLRVTHFNQHAARLAAPETGAIYNGPFFLREALRDQEGQIEIMARKCLETGDRQEAEISFRTGDRTVVVMQVISLLLDLNGEAIGTMGVGVDITKKVEAERALAQINEELEERTDALEAANKELESFAYSVSHDLRSPLRTLDGFSQVVLEDYQDKLDREGQDYLQRIRNASQRMGRLIDDMLRLSRVTRADMTHQEIDLSRLATNIADRLRQEDPQREAELVISSDLKAEGDEDLLRALMENLLGNAWKFTSTQPATMIEFGLQEPSSDAEDGDRQANIYFVRDNGVGFDPKYQDKLFQAFQRLHTTEEFPGTGIGLATVQRIVNRHGGRVWAESREGLGATLFFTLGSKES